MVVRWFGHYIVNGSKLSIAGFFIHSVRTFSRDRKHKMAALFYIMGASGSGKDTLLEAALSELARRPGGAVLVPRLVQRYITRDEAAGGEAHFAVTEPEFDTLLKQGKFCMNWQAHGLHYGIPAEVSEWLEAGNNVLVNGSRAYLPQARLVFPDLVAVLIQVSAETLKTRLENRNREDDAAIQARLNRNVDLDSGQSMSVINNDGALEESVEQLCELITSSS